MPIASTRTPFYIWQYPSWPQFTIDEPALAPALQATDIALATLTAKAEALGLLYPSTIADELLVQEVVSTAAIEGERLDLNSVRSSILRRLRGTVVNGPQQRHVDGLVDVIADATTASDAPLTDERLFRWQAALFPEGHSGIHKIAVGRYRDHADAMQIVSGLPGKERVHYEAVPSANVPQEMRRFLAWFEATATGQQHTLIRAALAHLWFESIHPFEDGNGRLGRAIVDTVLAQGSRSPLRLISLSTQLLATRREYYDALNAAQRPRVTKGANGTKGAEPNDITAWVQWFVGAYTLACAHTNGVMDNALAKARFWASHAGSALNDRQRKVLQRLLDAGDGGFLGGLTADKYTQITGASKATATRDLVDLLAGGHLRVAGQGRATRYGINVPEWSHAAADIGC